jgi:hypothetical protein
MVQDHSVGRNSRILLLLVACCISMALWMAFAKLVAPSLIATIYRGESFSILNNAIKGQAEFPLEHYLQKWNYRTMIVLWSGIGFWLLAMLMSSPFFFQRFVGEATPGTLGAIRMWICFILLISTLWEDLPSFALLPLELRDEDIRRATYRLPKFSHQWSESAVVSMAYNTPSFLSDDRLADACRRSIGDIMCVGIEWYPS